MININSVENNVEFQKAFNRVKMVVTNKPLRNLQGFKQLFNL